jgi:hypothetical protein
MTLPPVVRITEWKMRWLFRKHDIWRKVKRGELIEVVTRSANAIPEANQMPGAKSQRIEYRDPNGLTVAVIHQYLNLDGSLGASGKPDPKEILINGIIYHQPRKRHRLSVIHRIEAAFLRKALPIIYFIDDHIGYINFNR